MSSHSRLRIFISSIRVWQKMRERVCFLLRSYIILRFLASFLRYIGNFSGYGVLFLSLTFVNTVSVFRKMFDTSDTRFYSRIEKHEKYSVCDLCGNTVCAIYFMIKSWWLPACFGGEFVVHQGHGMHLASNPTRSSTKCCSQDCGLSGLSVSSRTSTNFRTSTQIC